ncbi:MULTISPECIES: hypothetical protein [Pseudoalteromonas]|uniref:hypothetical protein n=1 Tax=Pseudoalteromonas TaxID=53246 RepID=UPI0005F9EE80|nr:hypothetical protein [Pseudoalteromonas piscicida]KJZ04389.1 hypothetical protein TW73_03650 [Pseudoalteromonas piscicida]
MTKLINTLQLALVASILIFFSSACSTYHEVTKTSHYTDKISTFLKTEDGEHIIFVGREHHYILRTDPTLAQLLGGPFQAYISLERSDFHISSLRGVEGTVDIKLSPRAPSEIKAKSQIYGFKSGRISVKLAGDRYDNGELDFTHFEKFSYPLAINFEVEKSLSEKASKAVTTPLKTAAEGAFFLLAVPVIAIICLGEERCFKH